MQQQTVVRLYSLGFMLVMTLVAFMSFTQPVATARPVEQQALYQRVPQARPGPPPHATPVRHGEALAYIRIPRFGSEWLWTVLEGTDLDVIANGPGHFTGSALPGERGNSAYAAHRAGHGDPFLDFENLRRGDEVLLSQGGATWTYTIIFAPRLIEPSESWVTDPTPGHMLTLTTCWPKYGSAKRLYVRARLTETSD